MPTTTLASKLALRFIAVSFFVLATYVVVEALRDLVFLDAEPDESTVCIVLAGLSLIVMLALSVAKRRRRHGSAHPGLRADSAETTLCAWL